MIFLSYYAVMAYIGWPSGVNKIIIDSTTVTVGDKATVKDSMESGKVRTRLVQSETPDRFSVTMNFCYLNDKKWDSSINDYVTCDSTESEKDKFFKWYKYVHEYGTNAFQFPSILLSTNNAFANVKDTVWYKITSAVEGSKSGHHIAIKMTWETDINGTIDIEDDTSKVDSVVAVVSSTLSYAKLKWDKTPETEPVASTYKIKVKMNGSPDETECTISAWKYDDIDTLTLYFTVPSQKGNYTLNVYDSYNAKVNTNPIAIEVK